MSATDDSQFDLEFFSELMSIVDQASIPAEKIEACIIAGTYLLNYPDILSNFSEMVPDLLSKCEMIMEMTQEAIINEEISFDTGSELIELLNKLLA
jgi:hypothetical protein